MLDFEREDELLRQAVGADSRQILSAASASWADRFYLARERMMELGADATPDPSTVLERDRLASYFGCAYGRTGLLARAGALLTLRDRLQRAAALVGQLADDAPGMGRLRREAQILSTFARERFARGKPATDDAVLSHDVQLAAEGLVTAADFVAAACGIDRDRGGFKGLALWAASDLGFMLAEKQDRPLVALAAFALARIGDRISQTSAGDAAYEHLVQDSLAALRRELWEATERNFARWPEPAELASLEQADRELEAVVALFAQAQVPSNVRARLLAEVFALIAATRANAAASAAGSALDGTLLVLAEGLAAETRSPGR